MTEDSTTTKMALPAFRRYLARTYEIRLPSHSAAIRIRIGFAAAMLSAVFCSAYAATENIAQGQAIASKGTADGVPACASCHGASGEGSAAFPRLGGAGYRYLQTQLNAFADGSRKSPVMQPFAEKLTQAQRDALALYYSRLPALPAAAMPADGPGAALATKGRWSDQIPACAQCHGPGGRGIGTDFPPLAGLPAAYITEQLQAWKSATRPPGPLALMPAIVRHLSDQDIADVSAYYAGTPSTPAADASGKPGKNQAVAPTAAPLASAAAAGKPAAGSAPVFSPPDEKTMPDGEYGKVIRLGQNIFMETGKYAKGYVGNNLNCVNCHLDGGRRADSAPLWAAFVHYPAFRAKTGRVDTLASRIQGCFQFSMNGKAPAADSEIITALQTYAFWMAKGAPVGTPMQGSGYPKLKKPALAADYVRGEKIYQQNCALCHGADGQGQRSGDGKDSVQVFPPLWGPRSFNWGAGMHQLGNAAGFIKANMPLGKGGTLSDQEVWDLSMFMNSHERPQDPRYTTSTEATRKKYHNDDDSMYGRKINGHLLGAKS